MLGRGAFGKVNLAMHKLVRKLVALKSLNKQALTDDDAAKIAEVLSRQLAGTELDLGRMRRRTEWAAGIMA